MRDERGYDSRSHKGERRKDAAGHVVSVALQPSHARPPRKGWDEGHDEAGGGAGGTSGWCSSWREQVMSQDRWWSW